MQIVNVLFDNISHIFKLSQLMAIVIRKHTFGTNNGMAEFTEIFNFFVLMLITEHFASACLSYRNLWLLTGGISITHCAHAIHFRALCHRSLVEAVNVLH